MTLIERRPGVVAFRFRWLLIKDMTWIEILPALLPAPGAEIRSVS